ncbi:hypothetical protein V8C43DRAFT_276048 [Trichoderma afarasin]
MAVRRLVFAVALAGLTMAKPIKVKPTPTFCPIICIDAISDCGVPYGGCYDPCVDPAPTPLPCDVVNSTSTSQTPVVVSPVPATPTSENPFAVTPGSQNSTSVTPASSGTPASPTPVIVVSPVPATTTGENPSSATPASETPVSEDPEDEEGPEDEEDPEDEETPDDSETPDSESPIAQDPIPAGSAAEGAETTDLADVSMEIGSSPENPLPWIPDENEDSWWW